MESTHPENRIYVACLAAYNNGHLHGAWIDADQDVDAIRDEINAMLKASPIDGAEEHAIHDYEGFGSLKISEYESIDSICAYAAFIIEHGDLGRALLAHFSSMSEAEKAATDHYAGCYDSAEDFAREMTEQTQDVPEHLAYYIDYDAMAGDMLINDIFAIDLGYQETHIFWSH
ncbi:MAG: antirestriction protein ArdA [Sulfitobacter sp.]